MRLLSLSLSLSLFVACAPRPTPPAQDTVTPGPSLQRDSALDDGASRIDGTTDALPRAPCASEFASLGPGVSVRRCPGEGPHAAVLMAGWRITTPSAQRWAMELSRARLASLGVSTLYAVEGPADVDFRRKTLAVDALRADLEARATEGSRVLVVAHSSGAHVAATLFHRAFARRDGGASALAGRVVYVNLDGDAGIPSDPERTLSSESASGLRGALFVSVTARGGRLRGFSRRAMESGQRALASRGARLLVYVADDAGCESDACAHLSLVNTRPSPRGNDSYARYDDGPVNTAWLDVAAPWLTEP